MTVLGARRVARTAGRTTTAAIRSTTSSRATACSTARRTTRRTTSLPRPPRVAGRRVAVPRSCRSRATVRRAGEDEHPNPRRRTPRTADVPPTTGRTGRTSTAATPIPTRAALHAERAGRPRNSSPEPAGSPIRRARRAGDHGAPPSRTTGTPASPAPPCPVRPRPRRSDGVTGPPSCLRGGRTIPIRRHVIRCHHAAPTDRRLPAGRTNRRAGMPARAAAALPTSPGLEVTPRKPSSPCATRRHLCGGSGARRAHPTP